MKLLITFLTFFLVFPLGAQGQNNTSNPSTSSFTPLGEDELSHIEGVSIWVTHKARKRAVEAQDQISAQVEDIVKRSDLEVYRGTRTDPNYSNAQLNISVETKVTMNKNMGFYAGVFTVDLSIEQVATLYGGQEVRTDTYTMIANAPTVLSGRGEALAHARNTASRTGMSETAIVTFGGPRKTLEIARNYVEAMTRRFIQDWSEQADE